MLKNTAGQGAYVYAVTTATGVALEGDAANITATISKDGAADGATNDANPTEIGGGIYWFDFTQAETNADSIALIPVSATSGVVLDPVTIETTTASGGGTTPAAVWASTASELAGVPGATPTMEDAIMWLYMKARNLETTTASESTVANDAGATIGTAAISDNGTTFTKGEFA